MIITDFDHSELRDLSSFTVFFEHSNNIFAIEISLEYDLLLLLIVSLEEILKWDQ